MIRGIHHIAIHVKDLDRALRFYKEAFGFERSGPEFRWQKDAAVDRSNGLRDSAARSALLKAGTCYIEVFEFSTPAPRAAGAARPSDHGYTHFAVDVTDIEAEYVRLSALGMRFFNDTPVDFGVVKTVYGEDPEGNIIEIQETCGTTDVEITVLNRSLVPTLV